MIVLPSIEMNFPRRLCPMDVEGLFERGGTGQAEALTLDRG